MAGMYASDYTDDAIIRIVQECGPQLRHAENQLFSRYLYFIREGMKKYSLTEEDAFTAYSDSVLYTLDNIRKSLFESRSSLKTYLYRIFHHKCVDLVRKNTTNKSSIHQTAPIVTMMEMFTDKAKSVIQKLIEKNDHNLLRERVNQLKENCKKLLLLFADGYSDKHIATVLNYKSAEVVKTTRLRCLDKLRGLYKK